jgi:cystathionine gamma-synthase
VTSYFTPVPLGKSLPQDNPHAVSVSLPTMADVIGYEENDPAVVDRMESGYPRFFMNKLVGVLCEATRKIHRIPDSVELLPLMSHQSLSIVERKFASAIKCVEEEGCVFLLVEKGSDNLQEIKDFIRHTGILLSSRKAEDILFSKGIIPVKFDESLADEKEASVSVKTLLSEAYGAGLVENIFLANSGMNAVYAVFEAINRFQSNTPRQSVIQAGWLYLDTLEIIRKYSNDSILVNSVADPAALEARIISEHDTIGAVFTEVPNNPLLECVDLPRLYQLCQVYEIPLIVDATIGTAFNLDVLPYCDIAVESLTKFACGKGDVLMGAVILNPQSKLAGKLHCHISQNLVEPYARDIQRLAVNMEGYAARVQTVSGNTKRILEYLEQSPAVSRVHSVLHPGSCANFQKIRKNPDALPGLISVVFDKGLKYYYDRLRFAKGPTLGTEFTLAMPYVYLAHYDMVKTPAGRAALERKGLHPELLRISIGTEPADEIIRALKEAGI